MKLIPHHQDDKYGPREYRSPDGTWRVVRTSPPAGAGTPGHAGRFTNVARTALAAGIITPPFERRRDALVFLDTTAATPGNENITTAPPRRREPPGIAGRAGGRGTVPPRGRGTGRVCDDDGA